MFGNTLRILKATFDSYTGQDRGSHRRRQLPRAKSHHHLALCAGLNDRVYNTRAFTRTPPAFRRRQNNRKRSRFRAGQQEVSKFRRRHVTAHRLSRRLPPHGEVHLRPQKRLAVRHDGGSPGRELRGLREMPWAPRGAVPLTMFAAGPARSRPRRLPALGGSSSRRRRDGPNLGRSSSLPRRGRDTLTSSRPQRRRDGPPSDCPAHGRGAAATPRILQLTAAAPPRRLGFSSSLPRRRCGTSDYSPAYGRGAAPTPRTLQPAAAAPPPRHLRRSSSAAPQRRPAAGHRLRPRKRQVADAAPPRVHAAPRDVLREAVWRL